MPPALAVRFDSLARCIEASVVGARILRDAGIPARVVPCAARAHDEQAKLAVFVGYSRAELAALAERDPAEIENLCGPEDELGFHVVIEAHPVAGRTLIDLTAGQMLGNAQTLVMPLEQGWPSVQCGKWYIDYYPALRREYVEERIAEATSLDFSGLQGDVVDLMRLAKLHRCDKERFISAVVEQNQGAALLVIGAALRAQARLAP